MSLPPWYEAPIAKNHQRKPFNCGDADLNHFLQHYARQSHQQGGAKTFVAVEQANPTRILGFYTLAPAALTYTQTPELLRRGLARHDVPGFRLARLAVDLRAQGQGLGGQLLLLAGKRCILASAQVGGLMLIIDAKNQQVASWYASYGAIPLQDAPLTLVLPLATLKAALSEAGQL